MSALRNIWAGIRDKSTESDYHWTLIQTGHVRLGMTFVTVIPWGYTVMVYLLAWELGYQYLIERKPLPDCLVDAAYFSMGAYTGALIWAAAPDLRWVPWAIGAALILGAEARNRFRKG